MDDNRLNNTNFVSKKNSMNRSTVVITALLIIIIGLIMIIGYLIYRNVMKEENVYVKEQETCKIPSLNDNKETEEKELVTLSIDKKELESLYLQLPRIKGTDYIDYNLFTTGGATKEKLNSINTIYVETEYRQVYYSLTKVTLSEDSIVLDLRVALYDKFSNRYYKTANTNELINLGTSDIMDVIDLYGGKYKVIFKKGELGTLIDSIKYEK